jgi:hypothetical protein
MDRSVWPPAVKRLHFEFDGSLGDAILEIFPCFVVTEEVKESLLGMGATGAAFDDVEVTVSDQFPTKRCLCSSG